MREKPLKMKRDPIDVFLKFNEGVRNTNKICLYEVYYNNKKIDPDCYFKTFQSDFIINLSPTSLYKMWGIKWGGINH